MSPKRIIGQKIGELLKERGLLSNEQLEEALKEQKEKGGYISQHFISLGFVSEKNIAECLSEQYGFPYMHLIDYDFDIDVLKLIPFKFVDIYSLLPVEKISNTISVVMADPLNDGVIDMLRQITGYNISVFISTYSEIRQAIEMYLPNLKGAKDTEKIKTELLEREKDLLSSFIQVKEFDQKREKRKYKRFKVNLKMTYYLRDKRYSGIVKDISYNGIMFTTDLFIPIEEYIYGNIVLKIDLYETNISAVLQVLRVETDTESRKVDSSGRKAQSYNIAGFFNFLTDVDRINLTIFLKNQLG